MADEGEDGYYSDELEFDMGGEGANGPAAPSIDPAALVKVLPSEAESALDFLRSLLPPEKAAAPTEKGADAAAAAAAGAAVDAAAPPPPAAAGGSSLAPSLAPSRAASRRRSKEGAHGSRALGSAGAGRPEG